MAGNFVLSGTPSAFPVAIIYVLSISATNWSNLVIDNILEYERINVVQSVTGTANRITVTGVGQSPVVDIASTYVGQTSITTLGTIGTGTWNGTAINATKGGTGLTSVTTGDLLYGSAANTWSALAGVAAGSYLRSGGVSTAPVWSTLTLPDTIASGNILYATGTNAVGSATALRYGTLGGGGAFVQNIASATGVGYYAQDTLNTGQTGFTFENNRGSFANYVNLTIYGSTSAASNLFGQTVADKVLLFADGASNGGFVIGTLQAVPLIFGSNNAEAFRILSTQRVAFGQTTLLRANNIASFVSNTAGESSLGISNTSSNAAAYTALFLGNSAGTTQGALYVLGGSYSTSSQYVSGGTVLEAGTSLGLSGTTTLRLYTNSAERARFLGTGEFVIGGTSVIASNALLSVQKSQNAGTLFEVYNSNTGTGSFCSFQIGNATSNINFYQFGSGYTTSGQYIQNGCTFESGSGSVGGIGISSLATSGSNASIRFYTNNGTLRETISVAGLVTWSAAYHVLAAGTATAAQAPLKFTSGTNLTTAEAGAMEYDGTNLFFTRSGTTRENVVVAVDNAAAPTTSLTPAFTSYYGGNTNALGDPNRWISVNIAGVVYKIPMYT